MDFPVILRILEISFKFPKFYVVLQLLILQLAHCFSGDNNLVRFISLKVKESYAFKSMWLELPKWEGMEGKKLLMLRNLINM